MTSYVNCRPSYTQPSQACIHFKISEIKKATEFFDDSLVIGSGCFGHVYTGEVFNGAYVVLAAIKRFKPESKLGPAESWPEYERLSTLRHPNLVYLIGYCDSDCVNKVSMCKPTVSRSHQQETILVCEYIWNGTLKNHLHGLRTPLSWHQRLNICIGVSRGLHYLHTSNGGVIHGDIKSSNILLTESWEAKLSDFGLLNVGATSDNSVITVPAAFGYRDQHSLSSAMLTSKSDVYSFGVVVLEVFCRKPAIDKSRDDEHRSLVSWVEKEMKLEDIIDSDMRNEVSPECLKDLFGIVKRCMLKNPKERPDMGEVLDGLLELQERFNNLFESGGRNISETQSPDPSVKEFTFQDLEKATSGFSQDLLISEVGFRKVFLGRVEQDTLRPSEEGVGFAVAVKLITSDVSQSSNEWLEEVKFLEELAHPNIIRLLGFCCRDGYQHLLVYEHMERSLSHFIHGDEPLSWRTRLHIMIGVARGLAYLYTTKGVLCHFQSEDILLDEDFSAKIGGFGCVKIQERRDRTHIFGYVNTDYDTSTGPFVKKNDIGSFGFVLLETITGRHLNNEFEEVLVGLNSLKMAAPKSKSNRRKVKHIMDPRLKDKYSPEGAFKCMTLAFRCIAMEPEYRPSRREILWSLEQISALSN